LGYPPQSARNRESHAEFNFVDGSGPLFSMYLERAGEEDKKMTDSWKADADGILIFVSPDIALRSHSNRTLRGRRLVYSPLRSQHWSQYRSRTSGQAPRISPRFILQKSTKSLPIRTDPTFLYPTYFQTHPSHSLHQPTPSG